MKNKPLLVADLFCGAGGSSTGAERAVKSLGMTMILVCVNHWPVAIETHKKNHPTARHYIEDVTAAKPRELVPEGYLDLLMASPECTHFSRARGGKPVNDQSRMNPWVIIRWLTDLDVRTVLIENVPEFVDWGPVDNEGHPLPGMKGIFFEAWVKAIKGTGYQIQYRFLNAADYGDATTRKRFFLIARKDRRHIQWPKPTHNKEGGNGLVKWRAAREIIDWTNPGRSLLDDPKYIKRPLSVNTRRRIARGLLKYGGDLAPYFVNLLDIPGDDGGSGTPEPFTINNRNHATPRGMGEPVHTITAAYNGGQILVNPSAEPFTFASRFDNAPHDVNTPIPSITNRRVISVVEATAEPFLVQNRIRQDGDRVYSTDKPLNTVTGHGGGALVKGDAKPFILNRHGENGGDRSHSIEKPLPTVTGSGAGKLIETSAKPFTMANRSNNVPRSMDEPIHTITAEKRGNLYQVRPQLVIFHGNSDTKPVDNPMPCQPTKAKLGLMQPQIVKYYSNERETESIEDPLDTITTKDRFGLASPLLVQTDQSGSNGNCTRPVDKPVATIVTKQNTALAEPVIEPLIVDRNHPDDCGRLRSSKLPLNTLTTHHTRPTLIEAGVKPAIELSGGAVDPRRLIYIDDILYVLDIRFRMLTNPELARAMSFDDAETVYEFVGTVAEQTKQIGNAVPCGIAAALVRAILENHDRS